MALTDLNAETDARLNRKLPPVRFPIRSREDFTRLKEIWAERFMAPILLQSRDEGTDVSRGGRDGRLLLTGDESAGRYCIEDVIYAPGWDMPAYHMEEAEEHIYLVEGELEITVGNKTEICGPGAFAFAPRNTTRAFRNRSSSPARAFQWSNPAGHDRALQELAQAFRDSDGKLRSVDTARILAKYGVIVHEDPVVLANDLRVNARWEEIPFDSHSLEDFKSLREMWASLPMIPKIIHRASESTRLDVIPGTDSWAILTGDECAGRAMSIVNELPVGLVVPPHYQPTEEELFYALSEDIWWRIGGKDIQTRIGSFAFAPRFGTHQFGNLQKDRLTFLSINSPAGHERGLAKVKNTDLTDERNKDFFRNWGWYLHEDSEEVANQLPKDSGSYGATTPEAVE